MNDKQIQQCREYLKQWSIVTFEDKKFVLDTLKKIREEYLDEMGRVIPKIRTTDKLIEIVLKEYLDIPEVYIKAFDELGGK